MSEKGVGQMETVLDIDAAKVFYDGLLTEPRLDHPEGLAVHRDGSIWCGGERGQIYRIEPDGSSMEQIAPRAVSLRGWRLTPRTTSMSATSCTPG